MHLERIKNGIHWIGVQNPDLRIFDVIMQTAWGTSYNSYLVCGKGKIAVIDLVKEQYGSEHIAKISELCDPSKIDYIICNHTEPDHSGSLRRILEIAPHATVVGSKVALRFLKDIVNEEFPSIAVGDGDTLDLGGKTLKFISAPYLHWPDSMFTYAVEDEVLFSGDVFGFHYAAEKVFDDLTPKNEELSKAQKYYFDVIMAPFKSYVKTAIQKIQGLNISVIGPSHGPVLRKDPKAAIARYQDWSSDAQVNNHPKKIFIGYVSCYGYTRQLAEKICQVCIQNGLQVEVDDLSEIAPDLAVQKIHRADAIALGSPTLNRDVLKPVWDVLTSISAYTERGKKAVAFGSFGWSGEAVPYIAERLKNLGFQVVDSCAIRLRPSSEDLEKAQNLAQKLINSL